VGAVAFPTAVLRGFHSEPEDVAAGLAQDVRLQKPQYRHFCCRPFLRSSLCALNTHAEIQIRIDITSLSVNVFAGVIDGIEKEAARSAELEEREKEKVKRPEAKQGDQATRANQ
jgi:hypothetical protein